MNNFNCLVFGNCKKDVFEYYILVGGEYVKAENCYYSSAFSSNMNCTYDGYEYLNMDVSRKYIETVDYKSNFALYNVFLWFLVFYLLYFIFMKIIRVIK